MVVLPSLLQETSRERFPLVPKTMPGRQGLDIRLLDRIDLKQGQDSGMVFCSANTQRSAIRQLPSHRQPSAL
jgi:hypothetical protein